MSAVRITPEERYVRACAEHQVALEGLLCPGKADVAPHRCTRWATYDRVRRVFIDVVSADHGHERELVVKADVRVGETALATTLAPEEEDDMPKGIPGSGGGGVKAAVAKARVLDTRRFVVGEDSVLLVRLRQVAGRDEASRFRIEWNLSVREGKNTNVTKGTVHFAPTEAQIREAWDAQLQAIDKRWTPAPMTRLKLAPIPAPPKGSR